MRGNTKKMILHVKKNNNKETGKIDAFSVGSGTAQRDAERRQLAPRSVKITKRVNLTSLCAL